MPSLLFGLLNRLAEILCLALSPALLPFLWRKRYLRSVFFTATDSAGGILLHAASVGEVNAAKPLLAALRSHYPEIKIVITTTTLNGLKTAAGLGVPAHLAVLDLAWLRKLQLQAINPKLIIIVETELWPNLLNQARKRGIGVAFVNARLSEKSLRRYQRIKGLIKALSGSVKTVLAQSEADAERFRRIFDCNVQEAGNLKYALQPPDYDPVALRARYGYKADDFVICLGSSRPGEEELLAGIQPALTAAIPHLKMIVAIRHPQRLGEALAAFPQAALFSKLDENPVPDEAVLLVDTIGHLNEFYALCDLALVGGSFCDFGGHNPLEPAAYAKPVLIGPYHSSCAALVNDLAAREAILVCEPEKLAGAIIALYQSPERRQSLGNNARACVADNAKALERHLGGLRPWLD